jgi:hypothetical protein
MKTVCAVLLALLLASLAQAQQSWTRAYGGPQIDEGRSVQQTSDGGYIVAGHTNSFGAGGHDVYLIKKNASGDTLWTRTYGGTAYDAGYSAQQTLDGGYIIAGLTYSFGDTLNGAAYIIKTNASGDILWTKTHGGKFYDAGYSVEQTSDRGYIIVGSTRSFGDSLNGDVYILKTNASGDALWTRSYGGAEYEEGRSVRQTSDGGYIISGYTASAGAGGYDVYLVKTDSSGDTIWSKTYGGAVDDGSNSAEQTTDGGYVIAGYSNSFGTSYYDAWLLKTNSSGDALWNQHYGGPNDEDAWSVRQTTDGGYIIVGKTGSFGAGSWDVYLVKTNSSGDTLWTRTYGGAGDDEGQSVRRTSDGGYIISGFTSSFGAGDRDVYLVKTDANGNAGVEELEGRRQEAAGGLKAAPNPFVSFARIPGHESERFHVYDISGKMVGVYRGNRIGDGLSPAVYFVRLNGEHGKSLRIVKVK